MDNNTHRELTLQDMEEDEVDYSGAEESDAETKPATPAPGVANVEQMLPVSFGMCFLAVTY